MKEMGRVSTCPLGDYCFSHVSYASTAQAGWPCSSYFLVSPVNGTLHQARFVFGVARHRGKGTVDRGLPLVPPTGSSQTSANGRRHWVLNISRSNVCFVVSFLFYIKCSALSLTRGQRSPSLLLPAIKGSNRSAYGGRSSSEELSY